MVCPTALLPTQLCNSSSDILRLFIAKGMWRKKGEEKRQPRSPRSWTENTHQISIPVGHQSTKKVSGGTSLVYLQQTFFQHRIQLPSCWKLLNLIIITFSCSVKLLFFFSTQTSLLCPQPWFVQGAFCALQQFNSRNPSRRQGAFLNNERPYIQGLPCTVFFQFQKQGPGHQPQAQLHSHSSQDSSQPKELLLYRSDLLIMCYSSSRTTKSTWTGPYWNPSHIWHWKEFARQAMISKWEYLSIYLAADLLLVHILLHLNITWESDIGSLQRAPKHINP